MTLQITDIPNGAAALLAAMHGACFPDDPWDAAALERILELPGALGYLGWAADDPVGFMLARDLGDEIEILSLGVLPEWRRRGVGHALLEAVLGEAGRRRVAALVLEVAEDNAAARQLYTALGFTRVGRRPRYYRRRDGAGDALILRRGVAGGVTRG